METRRGEISTSGKDNKKLLCDRKSASGSRLLNYCPRRDVFLERLIVRNPAAAYALLRARHYDGKPSTVS